MGNEKRKSEHTADVKSKKPMKPWVRAVLAAAATLC